MTLTFWSISSKKSNHQSMCLSSISVSPQDSTEDLQQTLQKCCTFLFHRSAWLCHWSQWLHPLLLNLWQLWRCIIQGPLFASSLPGMGIIRCKKYMERKGGKERCVLVHVSVQPNHRMYEKSMVTNAAILFSFQGPCPIPGKSLQFNHCSPG